MRRAGWSPQSMSEAIRQGRPPRDNGEPLLLKVTGMDHNDVRSLRRWWRRNYPYVIIVGGVTGMLAVGILAVVAR